MTSFIEQAKWYATYHENRITKYTHMAGVPLLLLSFMILLGFVHLVVPSLFDFKFSEIAVLGLLIYYFRLNWRLALILVPVFIVLLVIADLLVGAGPSEFSIWAFIIVFIVGCGLQIIGHVIEGKRPAFLDNFKFDLASPMFITAEILFLLGRMNKLKAKIYGEEPKKAHKK